MIDHVKVTFFMIVTDYDAVIASRAIHAFRKVEGIPFILTVYCNNLHSRIKDRYFPKWESFPFVDLVESEWQLPQSSETPAYFLEGPYESCSTVWDRELRKINTPYVATVDGDFEILNSRFVNVMLNRLDNTPNLVAMSTDYSPAVEDHYDSYSGQYMRLNERWNTWFAIYKREAFRCSVSLGMHKEQIQGTDKIDFWDTTGWFQAKLRKEFGCQLEALDRRFANDYIHYGAFAKNTHVNESNVNLYRLIQILCKRGFTGKGDRLGRKFGHGLNFLLFSKFKRDSFIEGYTAKWPSDVDTYP